MNTNYKYGEKSFPNGYNPFVVILLYRPLALKFASFLKNINFISPNMITIFGLIVFLISTYMISFLDGNLQKIGLILGPLWVFIDYLDGSLARLRGSASLLGKKLDALQDHLAFFIIPISIFISIQDDQLLNYNFFILIIILFNQYLYAVGIKEIYDDGQLPFFSGTPIENMNFIQKNILLKTKVNLGFHTLIQGDTLFIFYWLSIYYNISHFSLWHFLIWSIFRNIILFSSYLRRLKKN